LSGGEAAARDLTTAESFTAVDGNYKLNAAVVIFSTAPSQKQSYGPSDGFRHPQSDASKKLQFNELLTRRVPRPPERFWQSLQQVRRDHRVLADTLAHDVAR